MTIQSSKLKTAFLYSHILLDIMFIIVTAQQVTKPIVHLNESQWQYTQRMVNKLMVHCSKQINLIRHYVGLEQVLTISWCLFLLSTSISSVFSKWLVKLFVSVFTVLQQLLRLAFHKSTKTRSVQKKPSVENWLYALSWHYIMLLSIRHIPSANLAPKEFVIKNFLCRKQYYLSVVVNPKNIQLSLRFCCSFYSP